MFFDGWNGLIGPTVASRVDRVFVFEHGYVPIQPSMGVPIHVLPWVAVHSKSKLVKVLSVNVSRHRETSIAQATDGSVLESDVIVSCTFDLNDENCPVNKANVWSTRLLSDGPSIRPTSDHTRGGQR